eukprot:1161125-Pelagomonas_calceolata.AAC.9
MRVRLRSGAKNSKDTHAHSQWPNSCQSRGDTHIRIPGRRKSIGAGKNAKVGRKSKSADPEEHERPHANASLPQQIHIPMKFEC